MTALDDFNALKNMMAVTDQLIGFLRTIRGIELIIRFDVLPVDDSKILERNWELNNKAIELYGKLWQQICEDNKIHPKFGRTNQLAGDIDLVFSGEAKKRLQEFQEFIEANQPCYS